MTLVFGMFVVMVAAAVAISDHVFILVNHYLHQRWVIA